MLGDDIGVGEMRTDAKRAPSCKGKLGQAQQAHQL
jgi:hypothetical protein